MPFHRCQFRSPLGDVSKALPVRLGLCRLRDGLKASLELHCAWLQVGHLRRMEESETPSEGASRATSRRFGPRFSAGLDEVPERDRGSARPALNPISREEVGVEERLERIETPRCNTVRALFGWLERLLPPLKGLSPCGEAMELQRPLVPRAMEERRLPEPLRQVGAARAIFMAFHAGLGPRVAFQERVPSFGSPNPRHMWFCRADLQLRTGTIFGRTSAIYIHIFFGICQWSYAFVYGVYVRNI